MPGDSEAVDGGHRVHPADEQRQPFPGQRVGPHEVRGHRKAENPGGLADALGRQIVSLARRQLGGAVTHPPDGAVGQQTGQGAVNRGVRLAENERQFRRIDERHPAEKVQQLSVRESHKLRVERRGSGGNRHMAVSLRGGRSPMAQGLLSPSVLRARRLPSMVRMATIHRWRY